MARKPKPKPGDVFMIPLTESECVLGQVVELLKPLIYLVIFCEQWRIDEMPTVSSLSPSNISLGALTFDAKFWHGHWPIVGNRTDNLDQIARPVYKVGLGDGMVAETLDRSRRRPINEKEENLLHFRDILSPARLEKIIKSYNHFSSWDSNNDSLLYEQIVSSSKIAV